jgi:hypothetical protein
MNWSYLILLINICISSSVLSFCKCPPVGLPGPSTWNTSIWFFNTVITPGVKDAIYGSRGGYAWPVFTTFLPWCSRCQNLKRFEIVHDLVVVITAYNLYSVDSFKPLWLLYSKHICPVDLHDKLIQTYSE